MFIAVPSAIKTFNWLGTLWGGNIRFTAADAATRSRFVAHVRHRRAVGHLHGQHRGRRAHPRHLLHRRPHPLRAVRRHRCSASSAAIYFWYPKMFGRMMNETLGKIHFWLSFIFFNCTFFPMHILGIGGMPAAHRRLHATTRASAHYQPMNQFISYLRLRPGAGADPVRDQLHRELDLGPEGPAQPVGSDDAGMGEPPAPRRTATSRRSRSSTTARTSTASRWSRRTGSPQTRWVEGRKSSRRA